MARTRRADPPTDEVAADDPSSAATGGSAASDPPAPVKRPRGRPRKVASGEGAAGAASVASPSEAAPDGAAPPRRRRGRPRKADAAGANVAAAPADGATAGAATPELAVRPDRPAARPAGRTDRDRLTVEQIVAVEAPREFRLHPRDRMVAMTGEAAGTRQLFTLSLRGGMPMQITASEKPVSDPQWSPDGRRLAYVRDEAIWVVELDGTRHVEVTAHPAGTNTPRWSPDGRRIAFVSRRRGWAQVWLIDAPVPRRGRPSSRPRPAEPRPITTAGLDVERFEWAPDGARIAVMAQRDDDGEASQIVVIDIGTGDETTIAGRTSWDTSVQWLPDGGMLHISDEAGFFQVVRRPADLGAPTTLTAGERDHGEPAATFGFVPLSSPDGAQFTYPEFRDGLVDLRLGYLAGAPAKRGRGRPPKKPRPAAGPGESIQPWDGVWRAIGWLADGAAVVAVGESETRPQDLWLLPVPGRAAAGARPRQVTSALPVVLAAAMGGGRSPAGERIRVRARDGLTIESTLWRPVRATGRRGGERVPAIVYCHGGPTAQSLRSWAPFKQLLVREGFALIDVDFRGSTGYGREFRRANHGEWGHADVFDVIDAARWAAEQPWCDGRLAVYGGSYGGYLTLCALVEEPSLWRAGVDLYGDSEIAESYRHGDRLGRLDLHRMMGSPDDPARADVYRRGSPVYRAERIEAPLLILHGRKDKRVVPMMTERMVEALQIEGKHHEVHWYDDEGHGWERRENRRDAFTKILAFLKRHVQDETPAS